MKENILKCRLEFHPCGRIIILERDVDWKSVIYKLENELKIAGMIYFVITVEIFSGKFKIECVENSNKYLMNGYVSSFFEQPEKNLKRGNTTNTFKHLKSLQEVHSEDVSEKSGKSEDEKEFSIEYKGERSVSPPIPVTPQRTSTLSSEIPNIKPSPPVLSKNNSKKVLLNGEKKTFSIDLNLKKNSFTTKITSNEEFDDFFGNIDDDVVFCYEDNKNKDQTENQKEISKNKNPEERIKIYKNESINFNVKTKKKKASNQSLNSLATRLHQTNVEKFYRRKIPMNLHGKKHQEIEKLINITNIIFINSNGTIACGFTLKSLLALAEYSLYN